MPPPGVRINVTSGRLVCVHRTPAAKARDNVAALPRNAGVCRPQFIMLSFLSAVPLFGLFYAYRDCRPAVPHQQYNQDFGNEARYAASMSSIWKPPCTIRVGMSRVT